MSARDSTPVRRQRQTNIGARALGSLGLFFSGGLLASYPIGLAFFLLQIACGTAPENALYFSLAIVFGLWAVAFSMPWHSVQFLLTLVVVLKMILLGIIMKLLAWEATDQPLLAPSETAFAVMLGMFAMCLVRLLARAIPMRRRPPINEPEDPRWYLAMWGVCIVLCYGSWWALYFLRMGVVTLGTSEVRELRVGGLAGVMSLLAGFKGLSISAAILYAYRTKCKTFLTHPCFVIVMLVAIPSSLLSTSKLMVMEPFVYIVLPLILLHGLANWKVLLLTGAGALFFYYFAQPFVDYVRYQGGRSGSLEERASAIFNPAGRWAYDESLRRAATRDFRFGMYRYLPGRIANLERFAMYAQADHLIAGTGSHFTGWKTIVWGLEMIPPRFIYPRKPALGPGNYLAHIAGDPGGSDYTTQMAYSPIGNLYNAFGRPGVIVGNFLFFAAFWSWLFLWFGRLEGPKLWSVAIFGYYHHALVEDHLTGTIATIVWFPLLLLGLSLTAKALSRFALSSRASAGGRDSRQGRRVSATEAAQPFGAS